MYFILFSKLQLSTHLICLQIMRSKGFKTLLPALGANCLLFCVQPHKMVEDLYSYWFDKPWFLNRGKNLPTLWCDYTLLFMENTRQITCIKIRQPTVSLELEKTAPHSSSITAGAKSLRMKTITLPSASEVKKTKTTGKEAAKKRKASETTKTSTAKKPRTPRSSSDEPIDATPISSVPSYEIVPFHEDYILPNDEEEETYSVATSQQVDEQIQVEPNDSLSHVSSP